MTTFSTAPKPSTDRPKLRELIESDVVLKSREPNSWAEWSEHAGAKLALTLVGIGIGSALSADKAVATAPVVSRAFDLSQKEELLEPAGSKSKDPLQEQVTVRAGSDYESNLLETDWNLSAAPGEREERSDGVSGSLENTQGLISANVPTISQAGMWSVLFMGFAAAGTWLLGRRLFRSLERESSAGGKSEAQLPSDLINPYAPPISPTHFEDRKS